MTAENENDQESGSTLRAKYEAELAKSKALATKLAEATASTFKYVKADDLAGVEPDQFATKAQEIEQTRQAQAEELAKQYLVEKFGPDVDLDSVLKPAAKADDGDDAASRLASVGATTGTPVVPQANTPLDPLAQIRAALDD